MDGLRALAVALVIANHFSAALLPGGFVGVDIFFVISGFVVTHSILRTPRPSWRNGLVEFWRRRFFRIFPVLIVFVLVTTLLFLCLSPPFPPVPYNGAIRTGLTSLVGVSNLYLYRIGLDYFQDGSANPFLHTWSLGVEEQFYLLYSIIFFVGPGVLPRVGSTRLRTAATVVLGIASLGLFAWVAPRDTMQAYYFLPTRFWELAAGGVIAFAGPRWSFRGARLPATLQLAAAALLAATALAPADQIPSQLARIPPAVLCAAVLIATGGRGTAPVSQLLSLRPVVLLGLISYSLYLWHWPILAVFRSTVGLDSLATVSLALGLMLALAAGSWRFVERTWRRPAKPAKFLLFAVPLVVAMAVLVWTSHRAPGALYAGRAQNWSRDWMPESTFGWLGDGRLNARDCLLGNGASPPDRIPDACRSAPSATPVPRVLILGDSLASADWPMAGPGARSGAFRLMSVAHSGCPINEPPAAQAESCAAYWAKAPTLVRTSLARRDLVLVAVLWSDDAGTITDAAPERLASLAAAADDVGARIAVQAMLPRFSRTAYTCTPEWFRTDYAGCATKRSHLLPQRQKVLDLLQRLQRSAPRLEIWDPFPLLCPEAECRQFVGGKPIFRDYTHMSAYGAASLSAAFATFVQQPYRAPAPAIR